MSGDPPNVFPFNPCTAALIADIQEAPPIVRTPEPLPAMPMAPVIAGLMAWSLMPWIAVGAMIDPVGTMKALSRW